MFENYCKDGDCYVGIRTVGITFYLLIAQSIPMYSLLTQSIPIYLLHSQFHCAYLLHNQFQFTCLLHSQFQCTYLLYSQFQLFYLLIAQSIPIVPIPSIYFLLICHNYCEFSLHGILLSKVCQGCGILSLLTFTISKTFKN